MVLREVATGLGRRSLGSGGLHHHEFVDVDELEDHPHGGWHGVASRVSEAVRLNEVDESASSL